MLALVPQDAWQHWYCKQNSAKRSDANKAMNASLIMAGNIPKCTEGEIEWRRVLIVIGAQPLCLFSSQRDENKEKGARLQPHHASLSNFPFMRECFSPFRANVS